MGAAFPEKPLRLRMRSCHSYTYVPGASTRGLYVLLPGDAGAAFCEPERASSHAFQCSHQLPFCFVAPSNQAFASAGRSVLVKNVALGLPGGLSMLWI